VNLFQQTPYLLTPVPRVQTLLYNLDLDDDDALYAASLALEPRKK
jgi:hypothetical protein